MLGLLLTLALPNSNESCSKDAQALVSSEVKLTIESDAAADDDISGSDDDDEDLDLFGEMTPEEKEAKAKKDAVSQSDSCSCLHLPALQPKAISKKCRSEFCYSELYAAQVVHTVHCLWIKVEVFGSACTDLS